MQAVKAKKKEIFQIMQQSLEEKRRKEEEEKRREGKGIKSKRRNKLEELVKSNNLENIFDDIFSIEEVGIYKPDSKVYDLPINQYQIQKNEVVFLSANTWDVSAGGNYGYNSIWVNRNNNTFDNLDYVPKHQIKDLSKLLDII